MQPGESGCPEPSGRAGSARQMPRLFAPRLYSSFSTIMNFICASDTIWPSTEHLV
jgi:hypothetical protein